MKRLLVAIAASAILAAPAMAADVRMPVKAPPPAVAAFSWTGWYIGGFVGGAWADRDATTTDPCFGTCPVFGTYNGVMPISYDLKSSFIGGITSGYNWQNGNWVVGYESETGYLRLRGSAQFVNAAGVPVAGTSGDTSASTKIGDWYSAYTLRFGYTWDRTMLFGKVGGAVTRVKTGVVDSCITAVLCGGGLIDTTRSKTIFGLAAGAGIEHAIWDKWSIKAEYLFLGIEKDITHSGVVGPGAGGLTNYSITTVPNVHTVKVGLNYRWGEHPLYSLIARR
jgi:outer membrane immunogenic protein